MNQTTARKILNAELITFQKTRSIMAENGISEELADLFPWDLGPKCPVPALVKILDRDKISGMDLYNLTTIAFQFCPNIWAGMEILLNETLPEPDKKWATGLED